MPGTSLTLRLYLEHSGTVASSADRNRTGPWGPVLFKFVKERGSLIPSGGVHEMHENVLVQNKILQILLMYKVSSMFRSSEP